MTYFGFLVRFLVLPVLVLLGLALYQRRRPAGPGSPFRGGPAWRAVLLHVVIAIIYTTPWDNYLVATRVWWYDPALVTGVTLGWVPLEEYAFFVLQTFLAGTAVILMGQRLSALSPAPPSRQVSSARLRAGAVLPLAGIWSAVVVILLAGWQPGTYLALELVWALPPIALQLAFGADILWRYRRLAGLAIIPLSLYLAAADALAIGFGTWTINPAKSLGLLLGGVLPLEELLFFLLTNTLVVFGVTLLLAPDSRERLQSVLARLARGRAQAGFLSGQADSAR